MAVSPTGCRRCGRPHDLRAAMLAEVKQHLTGLVEGGPGVAAERARLEAEAQALRAALRRQLALEASGAAAPAQRTAAPTVRPTAPAGAQRTITGADVATPARDDGPTVPRQRTDAHSRPTHPAATDIVAPQPSSARNTLLTLGGVLLGIAAVVLTAISFTAAQLGGRAAILAVATLLALVGPLVLARRTLTATAETLAGFGLLAVLLDGYLAYSANLFGLRSTPLTLYSCVLCGLVAAVAAAYRLASHLRAPQFATLLAVQPVLPLLAAHLDARPNGFAVVYAVVAALNLGSVELLGRDPGRALRALRLRLPGLTPGPGGQPWPLRLRELAWVFFSATLVTSIGLSGYGLVVASTAEQASRSALVLLLTATIAVAGGLLSRRPVLAHVGGAFAAFALIAAVGRVSTLARPAYALVLAAGVAAAIALSCALLPRRARAGPRWGSLVGGGLSAVVVLSAVAQTIVATVQASLSRGVWAADVAEFADRVHLTGGAEGWLGGIDVQVPTAAALLTVVAVASVPAGWRADALVVGLGVITLALPGTGAIPWWAIPLPVWGVSTVAIATALRAPTVVSAAVRAGSAGLLGLAAIVSSLTRPGLTALTCALIALVAAGTILVAGSAHDQLGPYADRVADAGAGAGACTLPVAVGTVAFLAHARGEVLVAIALLATAAGIEVAMLAQVAARRYGAGHLGSAAGALGAAAGAVLVALRVTGATDADLGIAALLAAAAAVALATRTTAPAGPEPGLRTGDGAQQTADSPRSTHLAAGLATAALVLALARLGAVLVPGVGLVTTTAMVLVVALGVAALPRPWRAGPRFGSLVVGTGAAALSAGVALVEAGRTLAASTPYWQTDLATWPERVSAVAPYGAAVPLSLLLSATAAGVLLPRPANIDVFFILVCLGALSVPAVTAAPWWSASLFAGILATIAAIAAALAGPTDPPGTHWRRLLLAGVLTLYAVAASAVSPAATATVLFGVVGVGMVVAGLAALRPDVAPPVPGLAAAAALAAAPGAAACTAIAAGAGRDAVLGLALVVCAVGVLAVALLRVTGAHWDGYPGAGVGAAALGIAAFAAVPDLTRAPVWAAAAALLATVAAGHSREPPVDPGDDPRPTRVVVVTLALTAIPTGLFAAAVTTPAWVSALVGPFRTLDQAWVGYDLVPQPRGAAVALLTLLLLAPTSGGIGLILGGRRYVLAAVLPPLAAAAVVLPGALGASREAMPWVALGVALATGLGAALSRPVQPAAAAWLRGTAGVVCALTGGAGIAGNLATRATTLIALGVLAAGALAAGLAGRDPLARSVAWVVFAAAGLALPPTAYLAAGAPVRDARFGILGVCGVLVVLAWAVSRRPGREHDPTVLELTAVFGAVAGLALSTGSLRNLAAVLTIWGVLLGVAALRRGRRRRRVWLVRLALVTELAACWLLFYDVHIGLLEAYTLPFAAAAVAAGVVEQRRSPRLSSWIAYGPALAGAFLPSVALVLIGEDPVQRWVSVFLGAVALVIVGSLRGWRAPVVAGSAIAVGVAIVEMVRLFLEGQITGALLVGLAGVTLIVFGAFAERRLRRNLAAQRNSAPDGAAAGPRQ